MSRSNVVSNVTYIRWQTDPQNRSSMIVRSVFNFKTIGERRATNAHELRHSE